MPAPQKLHGFTLVEQQYVAEYDSQVGGAARATGMACVCVPCDVGRRQRLAAGPAAHAMLPSCAYCTHHRPHAQQVVLYKHDKTGAQLMSVVNSDENKTFGVTFRCAGAGWVGAWW